MGWRDWFKGQEQPQNLEEQVKQALLNKGIGIVHFRPEGRDYDPLQVVGIGNAERDSEGALSRFISNLPKARPAYAMSISIGTVYMGAQRHPKKKISAVVYTPTPPTAA